MKKWLVVAIAIGSVACGGTDSASGGASGTKSAGSGDTGSGGNGAGGPGSGAGNGSGGSVPVTTCDELGAAGTGKTSRRPSSRFVEPGNLVGRGQPD